MVSALISKTCIIPHTNDYLKWIPYDIIRAYYSERMMKGSRDMLKKRSRFNHWALRIVMLACAAMLLTVACEAFVFNHRAWLTRDCDTREVDLFLFTDDDGNYLGDGEPILITPSESNRFVAQTEEIMEEATALRVRLSGTSAPVELSISLMDESRLYAYGSAYTGVIVPGIEGMDCLECPLYTNGEMNALRLTFSLDHTMDSEIYIESVELDPVIPIRWNPLRMALCFTVLWLGLCMLFFPWRQFVYNPGKLSHKAVLLLPMVLLMLFYSYLTPHSMLHWRPEDKSALLWIWEPDPWYATSELGGYGLLFAALQKGQLSLLQEPSEELLALDNPYDPTQRNEHDVEYLHDFALYEGKYYMYFGLGPILLFYYPYYLITSQAPSFILVCLLSVMLATAMIYWAVTGMVRRYVKKPNLFLLALCCFAASLMAAGPYLATQPSRYENVVSLNIAMMAGAIGFGFHALMQSKGWKRTLQFLLCGLCFALQANCRANTLLITTAVLAPCFIGVLASDQSLRRKITDAACFLLPAFMGVGLVMAYNYLRFGSVAEFGQTHQITLEDIHYNVFRAEYIPQALFYFLLDFPTLSLPFPYVHASSRFMNYTGSYTFVEANVGILSYPLAWLALFVPSGMRRIEERSLRREGAWSLASGLGMAVVLMVITFYFAGVTQRYTYDMLLMFALAGSVAGMSLCEEGESSRTACSVLVILCVTTAVLGLLFGFSNIRRMIEINAGVLYSFLLRTFFPY